MKHDADIGLWGLGVMGRNLALNLADHGHAVAAFDPWPQARSAVGGAFAVFDSVEGLVNALKRPRTVLLMVKAGEPVEAAIDALERLLAPGDAIIDGGNSHYADTARRADRLTARGIDFIGAGISGGETGARSGPAIMAGGPAPAWERIAPLLGSIAATAADEPCCAYMGGGGAGHFVKMVHNGIEYAEMQVLAEAFQLLQDAGGLDYPAMQRVFAGWNDGPAGSYLLEITTDILGRRDTETGRPLADIVLDSAGQKGTGQWASIAALDLGVPAPTIIEAVAARGLSALKAERVVAASLLTGPLRPSIDVRHLVDDLGAALYGAKIAIYAQGFAVIAAASTAFGWSVDLARVARTWRGGCIIRSRCLDRMAAALKSAPANLMVASDMAADLAQNQAGWRRTVALAVGAGVPVPALGSALAYFDAYRSGCLPANLTQCQRDYFGAHGYARTDRDGAFHTDWSSGGGAA